MTKIDKPNKETIEALQQVHSKENLSGPFDSIDDYLHTIILENNKTNRAIQQVAATMAIEGMYLPKELIRIMQDVASGRMSEEDALEEWLNICDNKKIEEI